MAKRDDGSRPEGYKVGFAKPPESTQFRKGASGNPKGRPKGSKGMASILTKVGRERIPVIIRGKTRLITKYEAYIMQLSNRAANGDLKAGRDLMTALRLFPEPEEPIAPSAFLTERDEAVLQNIRTRIRNSDPEPDTEDVPQTNDGVSESQEGE